MWCVPQWLNCFVSFHSCSCFTFFFFFKWSFILTNNVRVLWARTLLFLFYFINMPFSRFVEFFHHSKMQLCTQYVDRIRTSVVDSIQLPFDKIKKKRNITNFSLHSFFLRVLCMCMNEWSVKVAMVIRGGVAAIIITTLFWIISTIPWIICSKSLHMRSFYTDMHKFLHKWKSSTIRFFFQMHFISQSQMDNVKTNNDEAGEIVHI